MIKNFNRFHPISGWNSLAFEERKSVIRKFFNKRHARDREWWQESFQEGTVLVHHLSHDCVIVSSRGCTRGWDMPCASLENRFTALSTLHAALHIAS